MAGLTSIRIEGGLLGPDVLEQLLAGDLPGQKLSDYGLESRRSLTDEIAAVFADARALWGVFQNRLTRLKPDDLATSVTRDAWLIPLLGLLGYEPRFNAKAHDVDGLSFAISHRDGELAEGLPIHMVGFRQELGRVAASGRPRMSPHALLQEYLNRTEQVWGLVTNGKTLRLLRDCSFVRRQAYVEFDLPAILEEQRFQDFAALYRLIHRSRMPRRAGDRECFIERYHSLSIEQGGRVREHLRDGVEECIRQLANGFLRHPANDDLRTRVAAQSEENSRVSPEQLYRQLLTLVYRFLFLLVSEDRGLLGADPIYLNHYGVARLRRLLDVRGAWTDHDDLWQSLRVLWTVFANDAPQPALDNKPMASALGLPVLNGDLFAWQLLDGCTLSNHDLLAAFEQLATYTDRRARVTRRVNYGALDVEELGSVYESLLELHPFFDGETQRRRTFDFVKGGGRKETGSYYTPPQLVNELVRSALDPVISAKLEAQPKNRERALLSIRVCDPACGSGHFLLAAARRIAKELARIRSDEDEPAPERVREAVRDVISHCIYGVDRNPLAVDLCRVALWLESHAPNKPLTFLDHRIRSGNSLIGVIDFECVKKGIPDEAFTPRDGDDKRFAKQVAKRNRDERKGVRSLFAERSLTSIDHFQHHSLAVDAIRDDSPQLIREKRRLFVQTHADPEWIRRKDMCDLWLASFFQPLKENLPPISSLTLTHRSADQPLDPRILGEALRRSSEQGFFHWPLEFPEVFANGGFDVVLGNPPFLNVIEGGIDRGVKNVLSVSDRHLTGTADLSYHFVSLSHRIAAPHAHIGLVQPRGFLNADSAVELRRVLLRTRPPQLLYIPLDATFFDSAATYVCLVVLGRGTSCKIADAPALESAEWVVGVVADDNWWRASQLVLGKATPLTAIARCELYEHFELSASMTTGDAYAVKPFVLDESEGDHLRLITTGLIDPDKCLWGTSPCRYLGENYMHPRIPTDAALPAALTRRLLNARRPKVLVAGLCDKVEAYLDRDSLCVGAVSTFSVFHPRDELAVLERLCSWLNSPDATEQIRSTLGAASVGGGYMTLKKVVLQRLQIPSSVISTTEEQSHAV